MLFDNKSKPQLEVNVINIETGETDSFFYDRDMSLLQIQDSVYEEGYELDEITTLENYLDHEWLEEYGLEIINDFTIMDTPLGELLDDYKIYTMVHDYNEEDY